MNYRGYIARIYVKQLRAVREYIRRNNLKSVIKIQRKYRVYRTNTIIKRSIAIRKFRYNNICMIQAFVRGFLTRLMFFDLKYRKRFHQRIAACIVIQSMWRMKLAFKVYISLLTERDIYRQLTIQYVIVCQTAVRKKQAMKKYRQLRYDYYIKLKQVAELQEWAATVIQKNFRAMKGRIRCDVLMKERKGKWKELYDETQRKRYFYNQFTGEIRYRMPQDLLDLIPRPCCDNCCEIEAVLECGICNEVFCQHCFESVHFGGRRKDHAYRSLYDYYNKRIDYGDDDPNNEEKSFPCTWPSEVQQDEIQGWMLRVAPIRDPSNIFLFFYCNFNS